MSIRSLFKAFAITAALACVVPPTVHGASVAFLELHDENGQIVELEPGGRFGHCAIKVGDRWLHAHPETEVELTDRIADFGHNLQVYSNPHVPDPTREQVERYLKMSFNHEFGWTEGDGTTYCARLVGELLGIKPLPAYFMATVWEKFEAPFGTVGLSPDDVHRAILPMGFKLEFSCEGALIH